MHMSMDQEGPERNHDSNANIDAKTAMGVVRGDRPATTLRSWKSGRIISATHMRNVHEREFGAGYFGAHNVERVLTDIDADYGNRSLLSQAWRAPCPGVPGQLIAGGAGARPDHPIS